MSLSNPENPASLGKLFSLERAMSEMAAAGASGEFLDIERWQFNQFGPPEAANNVWRINPLEMEWKHFSKSLFPDRKRPGLLSFLLCSMRCV